MKLPLRLVRILPIVALLAAMPLLALACDDEDDDPAPTPTEEAESGRPDIGGADTHITGTLNNADGFNTLLQALDATGLNVLLSEEGPYTIFAPADGAFDAIPQETLNGLLADTTVLGNVLRYHIIEEELTTESLEDGQELEMNNGETLTVSIDGDTIMIGDATIETADIEATNGIIHIIDSVLLPAD